MVEPASPTVAMVMSSTKQCADASHLPLWQITHSGQSERISTGSPVGTSPVAHGMAPWHERVAFEFEKETFFLQCHPRYKNLAVALQSVLGLVWAFPSYKTPELASPRKGS